MKIIDDRIEKYSDTLNKSVDLANEAKEEGNENKYKYYMRKNKELLGEYKELKKERERLEENLDKESEVTVGKPKFTTVSYGKEQMDKYLNNKESVDLLNSYGLKRPSEYKDKSLEEFQEAFDKGLDEAAKYKKIMKDVAKYKKDSNTGFV